MTRICVQAQNKSRNPDPRSNKLVFGTAQDSWCVSFHMDSKQIDWETVLDEVAEAGERHVARRGAVTPPAGQPDLKASADALAGFGREIPVIVEPGPVSGQVRVPAAQRHRQPGVPGRVQHRRPQRGTDREGLT
jgi:hypothetical protein